MGRVTSCGRGCSSWQDSKHRCTPGWFLLIVGTKLDKIENLRLEVQADGVVSHLQDPRTSVDPSPYPEGCPLLPDRGSYS